MTAERMKGTTLRFSDFGGRPNAGQDAAPAMRRALEAASRLAGAVTLAVEPGRYDFYPEHAARAVYYVSNTASETENPDPVKTIGIYLQGLSDFTLDGGGSLFVFHGKMTMLAADACERIEIRGVNMDYAWPTVTEMTVEAIGEAFADFRVHPDSRYEIAKEKLYWIGEGWRFHAGPMQVYDPASDRTWRTDNAVEDAHRAEELEPGKIRLSFKRLPELKTGWVLQARDGVRDQAGAFLHRSRDVRFDNVGMHFMHGLGIVGQYSENLTFRRLHLSPRPETGRTAAAFADFVHLSGCRGKISITDSRFAGAHDDAINVHGTHLRIVGFPSANEVLVRFMHPQTYGFAAFAEGDEIEWVRASSLMPLGRGRVKRAELVGLREMRLALEEPYPAGVREGDVIENVTWTPEVEIAGNAFSRIPTRGVLVTTRKRVTIERNVFDGIRMSAVLVADDAASWYESGRVRDMTLRENRFVDCGGLGQPVIAIMPENEEANPDAPVHSNIRIEDNRFEMGDARVMDAKSTRSLVFRGNTVQIRSAGEADLGELIRLSACTDVMVEDNRIIPYE